MTTNPSASTGGVPFATQPVVHVLDAKGATATTATNPVTLSIAGSPAGVVLTCDNEHRRTQSPESRPSPVAASTRPAPTRCNATVGLAEPDHDVGDHHGRPGDADRVQHRSRAATAVSGNVQECADRDRRGRGR